MLWRRVGETLFAGAVALVVVALVVAMIGILAIGVAAIVVAVTTWVTR